MSFDVRVVGGSVSGIVVALECARLGLAVELVASDLATPPLECTDADGGWHWFTETFALAAPRAVPRPVEQILSLSGQAVPVPADSILGIPSSPLSEEVVAVVGQRAASRAYLDRVTPVLTIGKEHRLGVLVDKRMGKTIRQTLVDPLAFAHFGVRSRDLDVAVAVPGLNEAVTRTGSLSTAVLARVPEQTQRDQLFRLADSEEAAAQLVPALLEYWNVRVRFVDAQLGVHTDDGSPARAIVLAEPPTTEEQLALFARAGLEQVAARDRLEFLTDAPLAPVTRLWVTGDGREWSLRIHDGAPDQPTRVTLQSSRAMTNLRSGVDSHISDEALSNIVVTLSEELQCSVELQGARSEASPFITLDEIHERNGILATLEQDEAAWCVGEWLHGGNDSTAIAHAKDVATTLRRQLLGLS